MRPARTRAFGRWSHGRPPPRSVRGFKRSFRGFVAIRFAGADAPLFRQLKAQRSSRTWDESKDDEKKNFRHTRHRVQRLASQFRKGVQDHRGAERPRNPLDSQEGLRDPLLAEDEGRRREMFSTSPASTARTYRLRPWTLNPNPQKGEAQTSLLAADGHVEEDLGGHLGARLEHQHHWPLHQAHRPAAQNITTAPARMSRLCSSSKNKLGGGRGGERGGHGEQYLGALLVGLVGGKGHREANREERGEENGASHLEIS